MASYADIKVRLKVTVADGDASTGGSSEEYWSMDGSLNQPSSVQDDGPMGCKLLLCGNKVWDVSHFACTARIRTG